MATFRLTEWDAGLQRMTTLEKHLVRSAADEALAGYQAFDIDDRDFRIEQEPEAGCPNCTKTDHCGAC